MARSLGLLLQFNWGNILQKFLLINGGIVRQAHPKIPACAISIALCKLLFCPHLVHLGMILLQLKLVVLGALSVFRR